MFAKYLEEKYGHLTVSINESKYSSGSHGYPDIVFKEEGIEVKRVEFLGKHRFKDQEIFYGHLGYMSLLHQSWNWLKQWCSENKKEPSVVIVLTWANQSPLFIKFSKEQINELQREQIHKKYIQISSWNALHKGELIK